MLVASPQMALLAGLALLNGCRRNPQQDAPAPVSKPSHVANARDAASTTDAADIACKQTWDCPDLPVATSCLYQCEAGSCRLWYKNVAKRGAGPCYGNSDGRQGMLMDKSGAPPFRVACDPVAGLYCDMKSHRCVETKARGSRCEDHDACGPYDQCTKGRCSAGAKVGARCWSNHCEKGAFCGRQRRCEPLLGLGAKCLYDTECQSGACAGHCTPPSDVVPWSPSFPPWFG